MRITVFFSLLLLLAGCRSNKVPDQYLQPEEMGKVLFAVTMAEEFVNTYVRYDSTRNREQQLQKEYQKVFLLFGTNQETFEKSYEYYKGHPELFKTVLDTVDARGQQRRTDLYTSPSSE